MKVEKVKRREHPIQIYQHSNRRRIVLVVSLSLDVVGCERASARIDKAGLLVGLRSVRRRGSTNTVQDFRLTTDEWVRRQASAAYIVDAFNSAHLHCRLRELIQI